MRRGHNFDLTSDIGRRTMESYYCAFHNQTVFVIAGNYDGKRAQSYRYTTPGTDIGVRSQPKQ